MPARGACSLRRFAHLLSKQTASSNAGSSSCTVSAVTGAATSSTAKRALAAHLGARCLAVDLSGHGLSPGEAGDMSPAEHLQDVLAAWDELTAHYRADPGRIGVCGSSYGACLAALAVRHRKVARLLLRAPTIVADDDLARPLRLRSCDRDPASASVLLGGLNRFHSPALVVESENDEVIPHETVEAYLNALPAAGHTVIANAAHALSLAGMAGRFYLAAAPFLRGPVNRVPACRMTLRQTPDGGLLQQASRLWCSLSVLLRDPARADPPRVQHLRRLWQVLIMALPGRSVKTSSLGRR